MNTLFRRDNQPTEEGQATAFLENPATNTFGFVIKPKGRANVVPELTLQDRRELTKTGLNNESWFIIAKRAFAANGRIKDIRNACKCSPSSAKKMYGAFNRAKKGQ